MNLINLIEDSCCNCDRNAVPEFVCDLCPAGSKMFTLSEPKGRFRAKLLIPVSGSWRSIDFRVYQGLEDLLSLNQKRSSLINRGGTRIWIMENFRFWGLLRIVVG